MHLVLQPLVAATLIVLQQGGDLHKRSEGLPARVHELGRSADQTTFAVEVDEPGTGVTRRIPFANATLKVRSVVTFTKAQRVAVLGDTGAAQMVTIVDSRAGKAIDQFFVVNASISPTGRWVVYEVFRGRGSPESGTVYGVYDLALPPEANRLGATLSDTMGVGAPVYPERQRRERRWDGVVDGDEHVSMSPIVWISDRVAAVVDRSGFEARLVTISMSQGPGTAVVKTAPFDLVALIDYSRLPPGENGSRFLVAESIAPVAGDPSSLTVTFKRLPELRVGSTRVRVW